MARRPDDSLHAPHDRLRRIAGNVDLRRLRRARRRQLLLELRCGSACRRSKHSRVRAAHLPGGLSATPALADPADSGARRGQDLPGAPVVPADGDRHLLPAVPADAVCCCRRRWAGSPRERGHADADEGAVAGGRVRRRDDHIPAGVRALPLLLTRAAQPAGLLQALLPGVRPGDADVRRLRVHHAPHAGRHRHVVPQRADDGTRNGRRRRPSLRSCWRCSCGPTSSRSTGASGACRCGRPASSTSLPRPHPISSPSG